ncbi:hypothetical protein K0M31_001515 [Melipona bicolor]|uniref:Uncharacterized protein n=1 Tax=Melipona bicolor TaxID=60889 RepID=A0AA40GFY2_9HYME|nr:hypothetical protein K0M31_001515 [Melipona bicolor]
MSIEKILSFVHFVETETVTSSQLRGRSSKVKQQSPFHRVGKTQSNPPQLRDLGKAEGKMRYDGAAERKIVPDSVCSNQLLAVLAAPLVRKAFAGGWAHERFKSGSSQTIEFSGKEARANNCD